MKRIKYLLLIIGITFISISNVNAETYTFNYKSSGYGKQYSNQGWTYFNLNSFYEENSNYNQEDLDYLYNNAIDYYNKNSSIYPYFAISVLPSSYQTNFSLMLYLHLSKTPLTYSQYFECENSVLFSYDGEIFTIGNDNWNRCKPYSYGFDKIFNKKLPTYLEGDYYNPLVYYSSNYDLVFDLQDTYIVNNFQNKTITFNNGDIIPTYYSSFISQNYTDVNLNNYEYVILNLKDYTIKNAFNTTLKVKGSIGITPVYEYGTVEKEVITDICNISYSDYTNYRFSILKNDLINNSVYIVKSCQNNSSFMFDNKIFDITYITADNVNDPVVTIGGVQHNTIPFDKLSNTVNKNTEDGFIPGESDDFSVGNVVDSITDNISSFWNSLSSFMSLVTKFFNTLPIEIRAVSITCFTTACTLGLIKILKS